MCEIRVGQVEQPWEIDDALRVNGSGKRRLDVVLRMPKIEGVTSTFVVVEDPSLIRILRNALPPESLVSMINTPKKHWWFYTYMSPEQVKKALRASPKFGIVE